MQDYLKDQQVTPKQARILFKFRTRMENFSDNFRGGKPTKVCPVCTSSPDTQAHSFECKIVKENIKIEGKLEDIYTPGAKKEISKTLQQIVKFREIYMEK